MKKLQYSNEDRRLVALLYGLMRDKVTSGAMEDVMERCIDPMGDSDPVFTNEHLARHAIDIAERLKPIKRMTEVK